MVIRSICPKCGKEGSQAITYYPNKANSRWGYLEMIHKMVNGKSERCYIGRVRTTEQAMGELNRPETKEDYERAYNSIIKDLRSLMNHYASLKMDKTSGSFRGLVNRVKNILEKYGY